MGKGITSLLAVGIGAVAYSMMRRRDKRNRMMNMIEPLKRMDIGKIIPGQRQMTRRIRPLT